MKLQWLLVEKNVKVSKKCFILISDPDYTGTKSSLWMSERIFVFFISVFSVNMNDVKTKNIEKNGQGDLN